MSGLAWTGPFCLKVPVSPNASMKNPKTDHHWPRRLGLHLKSLPCIVNKECIRVLEVLIAWIGLDWPIFA